MFLFKSKIDTDIDKINNLLNRGVEAVFPNKEFVKEKMLKGERLTIYYGIDPTGPNIHIGHLIPIRKLAEFQKLGHRIIFLIGDFTAMIGDPDKISVRKPLTRKEILSNLKLYKKQVSRFINFGGNNKAEFKFNSKWLSKMNFEDVLNLSSKITVDQMLKRDMFKKRMDEGRPIYVSEFMYPLMQGYDSVAMDVDGEIGGNDQTFNMLTGRDLMKILKNKDKFVIATKLLVDNSGKKMGKTEGNMISMDQKPQDVFGKIMSFTDDMIVSSFEILTDISDLKINEIKIRLEQGENPRNLKVELAKEIINLYFGENLGSKAEENFNKVFKEGLVPDDVLEVVFDGQSLMDICFSKNLVSSKTDFKRLVETGSIVNLDKKEEIKDFNYVPEKGVYKIGKKRFIKII